MGIQTRQALTNLPARPWGPLSFAPLAELFPGWIVVKNKLLCPCVAGRVAVFLHLVAL